MKKNTKESAAAAAPKGNGKAPAADQPKGNDKAAALDVHLNKTGRLCIGRSAAARLIEAGFGIELQYFADIEVSKGVISFTPNMKGGTHEVRAGGGRPYVSITRVLKPLGFVADQFAYDIVAKPLGKAGFSFAWADAVKVENEAPAAKAPAAAPKGKADQPKGKAAAAPKGNGKAAAAAPKGKADQPKGKAA